MKRIVTHILALFAGVALAIAGIKFALTIIPEPEFHEHADIAVYTNGIRLDLSQQKYMSIEPCGPEDKHAEGTKQLKDKVHMHDGNGNIIHVHYPGVTYQDFFKSLGMDFDDGTIITDDGATYANSDTAAFRYFVNGSEVSVLAHTPIRDLDRVLISYGVKNRTLDAELASVPNESCIASGACPHRGGAEPESCDADADQRPWIKRVLGIPE